METTELIPAAVAAKRLHVTYGGLAVARCKKRWNLPYIRIGRKIFYTEAAIAKFISENTIPGNGPQQPAPRRRKQASR